MVAEFSGLMESSAFLLRNFREEFQNLKNVRALKLGEGGIVFYEPMEKNGFSGSATIIDDGDTQVFEKE